MTIELNVTRVTLNEANARFYCRWDPFRIVNLFTPRSWLFALTFDEAGQNHLAITPTPRLTDCEILEVLNGRFPALYYSEYLRAQLSTTTISVDVKKQIAADGRDTYFEAKEEPQPPRGQITLSGYRFPHELQTAAECNAWFERHTWLGSRKFRQKDHTIILDVFGTRIKPTPEPLHLTQNGLTKSLMLVCNGKPVAEAMFDFSPAVISTAFSIRHSRFGEFSPTPICHNFWKQVNPDSHGLRIELDSPGLEWSNASGPNDTNRLLTLLRKVVKVSAESILPSQDYTDFQRSANRLKRERAARSLTARQAKAQHSPKISLAGKAIFGLPSCETELVALYMKLEGAGKLPPPFECTVLEYTPKQGIDALADFRLSPTSAFYKLAPVEFEHHLENYFSHEHPPEQTALIICWDKDDDELGADVCKPAAYPWLFNLYIEQRQIPVIMLSGIRAILSKPAVV